MYRPLGKLIIGGMFVAASAFAHAQNFPSKTVSLMVAWPAGGASDYVARLISKDLAAGLGQNVIVENSPGVAGALGTNKAMQAAPDGHTLMLSSPLESILTPLVFNAATYKAEDMRAVSMIGRTDLMVVTRKDLPVSNLSELIALLKASTGKPLSYCTPGIGSIYHLVAEKLTQVTATQALHVPYNGFPQCMTDLTGGRIDFSLLPIAAPFVGFVDQGAFKPVAVLSDVPSSRLPKVGLAKSIKGLEDFKFYAWAGLHVHGKVPDAAVERLNKAVNEIVVKPDFRKQIEATGATLYEPMTPQQAQALYLQEIQTYQAIAKSVNLSKQ